jgi:enoyl-CoA hydratase
MWKVVSGAMSDTLLVDRTDGVATVTLNRPESRNALNSELLRSLYGAFVDLEADTSIAVVILTGADPAFCAGLDLKELGASGENLRGSPSGERERAGAPWPALSKPLIGAVNGVAVTGGFELALNCDFLIASERAAFGDTHARVGLLPGWGLSVLLPQAIGVRRAKEMSLTGNFMGAAEALQFGLVNRVVAHDELLPVTRQVAADIAGNDPRAVPALLDEYKRVTATTVAEGLQLEAELARGWQGSGFDPTDVERRRKAIQERGRTQI